MQKDRLWYILVLFIISLGHVKGQSLKYESLAPIPLCAVSDVRLNPDGSAFVHSINKTFKGDSRQNNWEQLVSYPDTTYFFSMETFDDKSVFYKLYSQKDFTILPFLLSDGEMIPVFQEVVFDFQERNFITLYDEKIYGYQDDNLYVFDPQQNEEQVISDTEIGGTPIQLFIASGNLFIAKSERDSITGRNSEYIDVYDLDFNYKKRLLLDGENAPFNLGTFEVYIQDDHIIFYGSRDVVYYSNDQCESFYKRELVGLSRSSFGVYDDVMYYKIFNEIRKIDLNDSFSDSDSKVHSYVEGKKYLSVQFEYLVTYNDSEYSLENLDDSSQQNNIRLPFSSIYVDEVQVDDDGVMFAKTYSTLFRSVDDGESWQSIYEIDQSGNNWIYHFSPDNMGGVIVSELIGGVSLVKADNSIEKWNYSSNSEDYNLPVSFSIEKQKYRIVVENLLCFGDILNMYVSKDGGPFQFFELDSVGCMGSRFKVQVVDELLYFYTSKGNVQLSLNFENLFFSVDPSDNYKAETFPFVLSLLYGTTISEEGEVFLNPLQRDVLDTTNIFASTFYAPEPNEELVISGRAPRGKFLKLNGQEGSFIVNYSGEHFYRSSHLDSYTPVNLYGKSVPSMNDAMMDMQNRIILCTGLGRIVRAETTPIYSNEPSYSSYDLFLFPNPVEDNLTIQFSEMGIYEYMVYDMKGQLILSGQHSSFVLNIDTSPWADNLYVFKAVNENGEYQTRKFIKQ